MEDFDESDLEVDDPFYFAQDDFQESEEKREESLVFKIFKWTVSLLVIFSLLYLFGFRNIFLYKTTSPDVEQVEVEKKIDAEILPIPLNIIVLTSESGNFGSNRSEESVLSLVKNANVIWEQAGISLVTASVYYEEMPDEVLRTLYQNPMIVINNMKNFDQESINVLLVANLGGINGVSFGGLKTVAVADYTTVYDFRVLAHEVGHVLGLNHNNKSVNQLMYQGANGFSLSTEEINTTRANVENIFD